MITYNKPKLYLHVGQATHFLKWEIPEFKKYFNLTSVPSEDTPLLSFGPDVLEEASKLPASVRFAVLFPGFSHNPVYNPEIKKLHIHLIKNYFHTVFINPGPLEIAYKELKNISFYPFSVDTKLVKLKKYRTKLDSLIHISNDCLQKDWERSEAIMQKTGLKYEVYPPRVDKVYKDHVSHGERINKIRKIFMLNEKQYLPYGYLNHEKVVKKYQEYDGFVHVARDIKHPLFIDGKYTASFIEAGMTGSILFWHDTFNLGNSLKTVFALPLDPEKAAQEILKIRSSINVREHSKLTRQEMLENFNPQKSVAIRAKKILKSI